MTMAAHITHQMQEENDFFQIGSEIRSLCCCPQRSIIWNLCVLSKLKLTRQICIRCICATIWLGFPKKNQSIISWFQYHRFKAYFIIQENYHVRWVLLLYMPDTFEYGSRLYVINHENLLGFCFMDYIHNHRCRVLFLRIFLPMVVQW